MKKIRLIGILMIAAVLGLGGCLKKDNVDLKITQNGEALTLPIAINILKSDETWHMAYGVELRDAITTAMIEI